LIVIHRKTINSDIAWRGLTDENWPSIHSPRALLIGPSSGPGSKMFSSPRSVRGPHVINMPEISSFS
jgi:hypothetical protein